MNKKIAIFFKNESIKDIDCRNISTGNPGLGGTPFMFYIISYLLSARDNDIDVLLLTSHEGIFPDNIHNKTVVNLHEAYSVCEKQKIDYLLFKHHERYEAEDKKIFSQEGKTKLLVWCHNFASLKALRLYAKSRNVCRIIAVGKEQMDLYRDHKAFLKSEYIYNCMDTPRLTTETHHIQSFSERKNIVTYMGAIIPGKGFHILAKAWKDVLREVPDAQLYVIGNANLYGEGKLGRWKLAKEEYEESFMKYITEDNELLPSVHLMGILGQQRFDILKQTKVGVPNPSGLTETFCISAVEMQIAGARVLSVQCPGYLDTFKNGTLYTKRSQLAKHIIRELQHNKSNYHEAITLIYHNFSQSAVAADWERLLKEAIPNNTRLHDILPLSHSHFRLKWLKERLRRLKAACPILYVLLPSLESGMSLWDRIDYKLFKIRNNF